MSPAAATRRAYERHAFLPNQQKEVVCYRAAKARCENPKDPSYKNYGGRGIKFLFKSFKEFWEVLGPRPEGLTLERANNDGHYEPSNVKWATRREQNRNRRRCFVGTSDQFKNMSDDEISAFVLARPDETYTEIADQIGCSVTHICMVQTARGIHRQRGRRRTDDLIGKRFGSWTVLDQPPQPSPNIPYRYKWLCRCDCGTERWVQQNNFVNGGSTNCGCLPKAATQEKAKKHRQKIAAYITAHPDFGYDRVGKRFKMGSARVSELMRLEGLRKRPERHEVIPVQTIIDAALANPELSMEALARSLGMKVASDRFRRIVNPLK